MLVASRALQGLGGGAITVTAVAVIGEVIPLRDRGRYQGALGAVFGVTTVIGPLLGGLFTDHLSWRWAFWINVPVAVVVIAIAAVAIPELTRKPARPVLDYAGIVLVGLGATGLDPGYQLGWHHLSMGLGRRSSGCSSHRWPLWWPSSPPNALPPEPILPIRLFANPAFTVCCVLSFVVGFAMPGALTFLPTYMQFVDGVSATASGLRHPADGRRAAGDLSWAAAYSSGGPGNTGSSRSPERPSWQSGFVLLSRMDADTRH